jgi:hypothetical protein
MNIDNNVYITVINSKGLLYLSQVFLIYIVFNDNSEYNIIVLLRDVFHIGLVIGPRYPLK